MNVAFTVQGVLIGFYIALAVLFALDKRTLPMSLYYVGCVVKDAGVLVLGWWATHHD